jgi:hypothetical protein
MLAIDPGAGGGFVYNDSYGIVAAVKMPATYPEVYDALKHIRDLNPSNAVCFIEDVGTYMPGNSGPAAVTFATHIGDLRMALYALGISRELVRPQKWQKALGLSEQPAKKGLDKNALARLKQERKNEIKEKMQARFPHLKVTLALSDALGIFCYGKSVQ